MRLIQVLSLSLSAAFVSGCGSSTQSATTQDQQAATDRLLQAVRNKLFDPAAAEFRNTRYFEKASDDRKARIESACGQVNGKNRFGGYTGYGGFVAVDSGSGPIVALESDEDLPGLYNELRKLCNAGGASTAGAKITPDLSAPEWKLSRSKNEMDDSEDVFLTHEGSDGATMILRCRRGKTEAGVHLNDMVNDIDVRVRFDEARPRAEMWNPSTDYRYIFNVTPIAFARELTKAKTFRLEYKPYQSNPRAVTFDVSGLASKLPEIAEACKWNEADLRQARRKAADAALRAKVAADVHPCSSQYQQGQWCWTYPGQSLEMPSPTQREAIDSAFENAKMEIELAAYR